MAASRIGRRRTVQGLAFEERVISTPQLLPFLDPAIELWQLVHVQGSLDIRQVVLVPRFTGVVVAESLIREPLPGPEAETVQREWVSTRAATAASFVAERLPSPLVMFFVT